MVEYRINQGGELRFLKKKIDDLDDALKEASKLRDMGYSDVMIRKNEK